VDSSCKPSYALQTSVSTLDTCGEKQRDDGTKHYASQTCTATAAATKQFSSTVSNSIDGLPATMTAAKKTAFKSVYETTVKAEFAAALDSPSASVVDFHSYTGVLADSSRRLDRHRRRLASAGVASTFTVTLPAADAAAAQTKATTATTAPAGKLNPTNLVATLATAIAADPVASTVGNLTMSVSTTVSEPVECTGNMCSVTTAALPGTSGAFMPGAFSAASMVAVAALFAFC